MSDDGSSGAVSAELTSIFGAIGSDQPEETISGQTGDSSSGRHAGEVSVDIKHALQSSQRSYSPPSPASPTLNAQQNSTSPVDPHSSPPSPVPDHCSNDGSSNGTAGDGQEDPFNGQKETNGLEDADSGGERDSGDDDPLEGFNGPTEEDPELKDNRLEPEVDQEDLGEATEQNEDHDGEPEPEEDPHRRTNGSNPLDDNEVSNPLDNDGDNAAAEASGEAASKGDPLLESMETEVDSSKGDLKTPEVEDGSVNGEENTNEGSDDVGDKTPDNPDNDSNAAEIAENGSKVAEDSKVVQKKLKAKLAPTGPIMLFR